jgi:hypothetical protein
VGVGHISRLAASGSPWFEPGREARNFCAEQAVGRWPRRFFLGWCGRYKRVWCLFGRGNQGRNHYREHTICRCVPRRPTICIPFEFALEGLSRQLPISESCLVGPHVRPSSRGIRIWEPDEPSRELCSRDQRHGALERTRMNARSISASLSDCPWIAELRVLSFACP